MMLRFLSLLRDQRGNSVIEMALAAPLLATLFVGTVDISRAVSAKVDVEQAAQRALERVQGQLEFKTDQITALQDDAKAAAGTGSTATVTAWLECNHDGVHLNFDTGSCADGASYARYVQAVVTKSYAPLFGRRFFPNGVTVGGQGVVRVQ